MTHIDEPRPTASTGHPGTTLAVVQRQYGSPDVFTLERVPTPIPGPGDVLVAVKAASVNARDWHIMRGEPRLARLMDPATFRLRRPRVAVRGTDLAGIVEAVGAGVTPGQPGDAVFGDGSGTFAEHAVASPHRRSSARRTAGPPASRRRFRAGSVRRGRGPRPTPCSSSVPTDRDTITAAGRGLATGAGGLLSTPPPVVAVAQVAADEHAGGCCG
jgi:hypothetical protein